MYQVLPMEFSYDFVFVTLLYNIPADIIVSQLDITFSQFITVRCSWRGII